MVECFLCQYSHHKFHKFPLSTSKRKEKKKKKKKAETIKQGKEQQFCLICTKLVQYCGEFENKFIRYIENMKLVLFSLFFFTSWMFKLKHVYA